MGCGLALAWPHTQAGLNDPMAADRLPPLIALRVFESAARHLSFRRAAEELFVTPGAVSQQIRLLEDHVGVTLFHREGRRVALTEAGQAALPALRAGFANLTEAARLMRQPLRRSRVTVSVAPSFAAKWLLPRLEHFTEAHPDIDVWVSADMAPVDFAIADVDLAIRYGAGRYENLVSEKLLEEAVLPVCSPVLMEAAPIRTPGDLAHHTLLHDSSSDQDDSCPDWSMWLKAQGVAGIDPTRGPRFNQSSLVIEAAVAGRGVALAKRTIAEADLAAGRLIAPFAGAGAPTAFAYYIVWPKTRDFGLAQSTFIAWLRDQAAGAGANDEHDRPAPPIFAAQGI
jgi:LysR family transcriptional regulator, glycine cleavage system transcriptional activator